MTADRLYEQLDRVRNLISNATANPLPDADDQDAAIHHLELVRGIYRAAHDAAAKAKSGKPRAANQTQRTAP